MNYSEGLRKAKANGITGQAYANRINKYGWGIERAATKPARQQGHVQALIKEHGITKAQFYYCRGLLPKGTDLRGIAEVAAARSRAKGVQHG